MHTLPTDTLDYNEFRKVFAERCHDRLSTAVWSGDKAKLTELILGIIDAFNYQTSDHKRRRDEANEAGPAANDCTDLR